MTTSPAQDVPSRLYLTIGRLSRSLRQASVTGPGHGAISALATLVRHGELRLGDLAVREGVAAATMSRIVASLADGGYVERKQDPADRRAWLAQPTEQGRQLLAEVRSKRIGELSRRLDALEPEQREALDVALPALESLLDRDDR